MADNAAAPSQKDATNAETTAQSDAAPETAALTRQDLQDLLMPLTKTIENQRSLHDRQMNAMRIQLANNMRAVTQQSGYDGDVPADQGGYIVGTKNDQETGMMLAARKYPGFDESKVTAILQDDSQVLNYVRTLPDGRTIDWNATGQEVWKDIAIVEANEIRAKAAQAEAAAEVQREGHKRRAVISGSTASLPQEDDYPSEKEAVKNMTDEDLRASLREDASEHDPPSFMKRQR